MAFMNGVIARLAKAGHKVEQVVADTHAASLENVIKKTSASDFSLAKLNAADRKALTESTDALIASLKKSGLNDLQANSVLKDAARAEIAENYGTGAGAALAQRNFNDSLSAAYIEKRASKPAAGGNGKPPGGGDEPPKGTPAGPQSNQTEAEKAATARTAAERANTLTDATYGARTNITKGLRGSEQGGFAEKKAAFDLIDQNMEGSGYIKRPQNAAEAETMAKSADTREVEAIRNILLTRPGQGSDGKFIDGVVTQAEWGKLRSSLRSDLLDTERKEIVSKIEQTRIAGGTMPDAPATFTRLRDIMRDPDYAASHKLSAEAKAAQDTGVARKAEDIEKDLRAGKPVGETEVIALGVKYGRADKEVINAYAMRAMSKDAKTFLSRDDIDAFRTQLLKNNQLDLAGPRTKDLTKEKLADHLNLGKKISAADFDELVVKGQNAKRPWTVNVPFGEKMGLNGIEVPKWVRNSAIGVGLGYFGLVNVPGSGDAVDGGFVGAAYKGVVSWTGGSFNPFRESKIGGTAQKELSGVQAEAAAAQEAEAKARMAKDRIVSIQSTGTRDAEEYAASRGVKVPGSTPAGTPVAHGLSVVDADAVVGELNTKYSLIDLKQMTDLAQVISDKAKGGAADTLSVSEYAEVKQDSAYKGLPKTAREKLDEILAPKLAP